MNIKKRFDERREDAKNTYGLGRMAEDKIGRQIVDIALKKHGITRTANQFPEEIR